MKESNVKFDTREPSVTHNPAPSIAFDDYAMYVGMDVHKDSIAVAVAHPGRNEPEYRGEIASSTKSVKRLIEQSSTEANGRILLF